MVTEIRDPTGDTDTGAGYTVNKNQRDRTTETARVLVAEEEVNLL